MPMPEESPDKSQIPLAGNAPIAATRAKSLAPPDAQLVQTITAIDANESHMTHSDHDWNQSVPTQKNDADDSMYKDIADDD